MAADLQLQARALGDPTRHRLFRYIADAPAPVTVTELTGYAGLNHNAVRRHLAVLAGAGLVTEEAGRRDRPGQPRLLYRLHPEAAGEWGTPGAYAWLAGRQEGHRRAAEMPATGDPAGLPEQEMSRLGFRPARTDRGPRTADRVTLGRCPFAEGLGGLIPERLTVRPARRAGCRLTVRRAAAERGISGYAKPGKAERVHGRGERHDQRSPATGTGPARR
jgi:DNA-binding transcriptional ArsR family regulator